MHRLGIREKRNKTDGERHKRQTKKTDTLRGRDLSLSPPRRSRAQTASHHSLHRHTHHPAFSSPTSGSDNEKQSVAKILPNKQFMVHC